MHPLKPSRHATATTTLACALVLAACSAHAGEFSFGGKMFADSSHVEQTNYVTDTHSSDTDADLKRLYLDANYAFDSDWSAHLTADVNWLRGHRGADLWLRHLYLQRKFANDTIVRVGVDDMPVLSLTSKWYGYRYVDPIGASLAKIDSSADWGVHVKTRLAPGVDMAVAVVTGGGYKRPDTGHRADVEALVSWQPSKHTVLAVGGYNGQLAADGDAARPLQHTARRADLIAAYAGDAWRVGMRYSYASNWANLYSMQSDRVRNLSSWASVRVAPHWSVFARYDHTDNSVLIDPSRKTRYANAGVEWQPSKPLRLALVFKHNSKTHDDVTVNSGNEIGVWSQWVF